jgi:hypothetical protein
VFTTSEQIVAVGPVHSQELSCRSSIEVVRPYIELLGQPPRILQGYGRYVIALNAS